MGLSRIDRSLLRSYPELRELIEDKSLDESEEECVNRFGKTGFTTLDDPTTIPKKKQRDG